MSNIYIILKGAQLNFTMGAILHRYLSTSLPNEQGHRAYARQSRFCKQWCSL